MAPILSIERRGVERVADQRAVGQAPEQARIAHAGPAALYGPAGRRERFGRRVAMAGGGAELRQRELGLPHLVGMRDGARDLERAPGEIDGAPAVAAGQQALAEPRVEMQRVATFHPLVTLRVLGDP